MQVALNGNSVGPQDPNFIHFDEEQAGTLLPSAPGYPFFLPQLQISPKGRLCFWNFPNKIFAAVVSNPVNKGTSNYLRDAKAAALPTMAEILSGKAPDQFPPVPGDMGTNGPNNQYFWGNCNSYFIVTQAFADEIITQLITRTYIGNVLQNPNITLAQVQQEILTDPGYAPSRPIVGKYNTDNGSKPFYPWDWIAYNIQYYLDRFLKVPYYILNGPQYGDDWPGTLAKESVKGALPQWLNATNFFVNLTANPSFWQSASNALPVVILSAVALVSAGAAAPALVALLGPSGGAAAALGLGTGEKALISAVNTSNTKQAAQTNLETAMNAGGATNMTETLASVGLNSTDVIFFSIAAIVIIAVLIFYHNK